MLIVVRSSMLTLSLVLFGLGCDAGRPSSAPSPGAPPHAGTDRIAPSGTSQATDTAPSPVSSASSASNAAPSTPPPETPPASPPTVESFDVPGDIAASIVRARDGRPPRTLFLPGVCSNANAYLHGFIEAAHAHGGVVGVEGDRPCAPGFRSITSNVAHEEPRIEAVLAAAGAPLVETDTVTLVGYSLGATLAEKLAEHNPRRYTRLVLIGSPKNPDIGKLKSARAVATMSCSTDVPGRMRAAVPKLEALGIASKYFEMPGCSHGNLAEGDRIFGEVFTWLTANAPHR